MTDGPTPEQQDMRAVGVATGLGCSIVAALILCIGGGVWLDSRFGTSPVLTLLGVVLGLVVAGYQLWELAKVGSKTARPGPMTRGRVQDTPESAVSATPANEVLKDAVSATTR